jgi:hypothetical protein
LPLGWRDPSDDPHHAGESKTGLQNFAYSIGRALTLEGIAAAKGRSQRAAGWIYENRLTPKISVSLHRQIDQAEKW